MDKRSNIIRTLRREGFESIPTDFDLCESQINAFEKRYGHRDYASFFGLNHRDYELQVKKNFENGHDLYKREKLPDDTVFDVLGVGHSKGSDAAFHMTRMHHPLKGADLNEVIDYPYPEVDENSKNIVRKNIAEAHKSNLAAVGRMEITIWESAWYLRSMDELMMDMMLEDEKATILLNRIKNFACSKAGMFTAEGADILKLGDDIGMQNSIMMDVTLWEKWLKPPLAEVIRTAKDINPDVLIFYHSCGYITPFIDHLIEIGVDILNPIQPECMDFDEIHDSFGDKLSFWGTIGTQKLLPFGKPDEVKKVCLSRLKKCGKKGGLVIGPTHLVEPEVSWENLTAIVDAVKEFESNEM